MFLTIAKPKKNEIVREDFRQLITYLINCHPGLAFLKPTIEFHEKYGIFITKQPL